MMSLRRLVDVYQNSPFGGLACQAVEDGIRICSFKSGPFRNVLCIHHVSLNCCIMFPYFCVYL